MPTRGKRYAEAAKTVGDGGTKSPKEALELVKSVASAKFDETVDVAIKLGVDPKHGDQMVRGNTTLPHGTGKVRKVAVITKGDGVAAAEAAVAKRRQFWMRVVKRRFFDQYEIFSHLHNIIYHHLLKG